MQGIKIVSRTTKKTRAFQKNKKPLNPFFVYPIPSQVHSDSFTASMSENAANNIMETKICTDAIVSELQKKKVHLFYCLECEELARNIAAESDHITLQSINWRFFPLSPFSGFSFCVSGWCLLGLCEFRLSKNHIFILKQNSLVLVFLQNLCVCMCGCLIWSLCIQKSYLLSKFQFSM